jgi:hypothetical protein
LYCCNITKILKKKINTKLFKTREEAITSMNFFLMKLGGEKGKYYVTWLRLGHLDVGG